MAAAMAALALGGPAHAQVNGSGVITSGTGTITNVGTTTNVNTTSNQTVVTWRPGTLSPAGTPYVFLAAGNTLRFSGFGDYIVLNRFDGVNPVSGQSIPAGSAIRIDGTVNSFENITALPQRGNIWFYHAGGFLIGSTATFNVGGLVLTANDIDTTGGLLGPAGEIRFRGAAGSTSAVQIDAGASINVGNTTPGGAYIAVVAPRVVQRGFVDVDGSIAYVAAEQADITINNGLFDINVLVGAEGGTVIDHSGVTTGTAQRDGDGLTSRIYMVAMPKNTAVSMLVAGQVGYRDPVTAQVEPNGNIRLSAGFNVAAGEIVQTPGSAVAADMVIRDIIFNSELIARASNNLDAAPVSTIPTAFPPTAALPPQLGLLRFNQDAVLIGDNRSTMTIRNQQGIVAQRNLSLVSNGLAASPGLASLSLGYNAAQPGNRPQMTVGGFLALDASRIADPFTGGNAAAGRATMSVNGGLVNAAAIILNASAVGGYGSATQGGNANGGIAELIVTDAGAQVQAGILAIDSSATGGGARENANLGIIEVAQQGGVATGGLALASVSGGALLNVGQVLDISARAIGGTGAVVAGNAFGGQARLSISGATSRVDSPASLFDTSAQGGSFAIFPTGPTATPQGGNGFGGVSEIVTDGIANLGLTSLRASGLGGIANSGINRGGDGIGGFANLLVNGGTTTMIDLLAEVDGLAGGGDATNPAVTQSTHGVGQGGSSAIRADAGAIVVTGDVTITGNGNTWAGSAINTLARLGGTVELRASNGGSMIVGGNINVDTNAGSDPQLGQLERSSQNANGGVIRLSAVGNSRISAAGLRLNSNAATAAATGTLIGAATGGSITLESRDTGQIIVGNNGAILTASGVGGSGPIGGQGIGGSIDLIAEGGRIDLNQQNQFDANGTSGLSNSTTTGPAGQGGIIRLQTRASAAGTSEIVLGDSIFQANGATGAPATPATNVAGNGVGGQFLVDMQSGVIRGRTLNVLVNGISGASLFAAPGGQGDGGVITLNLSGGTLDVDAITLSADGVGSEGGNGQSSGSGRGGQVTVNLTGGAIRANDMLLSAAGRGAQGREGIDGTPNNNPVLAAGNGGAGSGGTVIFNADAGTANITQLRLGANGIGGAGGAFNAVASPLGNTGNGGAGTGGAATFNRRGATVNIAGDLIVEANGTGGAGGALRTTPGQPGTSTGGNGGMGTGGTATVLTTAINGTIGAHRIAANALGGAGATGAIGGNGGQAIGGLAQLIVDNVNAGTLVATLASTANGGAGGNGTNGTGGNGGNAAAGATLVEVRGANGRLRLDGAVASANATGGNGGTGGINPAAPPPALNPAPASGSGGNAIGGNVRFEARGGGLLQLTGGAGPVGISSGIGGNGANGANNLATPGLTGGNGGNGGLGNGGQVTIVAAGGTIELGGEYATSGLGGNPGTGGQGTLANGNNGGRQTSQTGAITVQTLDAAGLAGRVTLNNAALRSLSPDAVGGGGSITLNNSSVAGGITATGNLLLETTGAIPAGLPNEGINVTTTGSDMNLQNLTIRSATAATLAANGATSIVVTGTADVEARGTIRMTHTGGDGVRPTLRVTGDARFVSLGNAIIFDSITPSFADVGGNLTMTAPLQIAVNRVRAGGNAVLQSGGNVTVQNELLAGRDATVTAGGLVSLARISAGDDIIVNATGSILIGDGIAQGNVDSEGDGQNIRVTSGLGTTITRARANSDLVATVAGDLDIGAGGVDVGRDSIANVGDNAVLNRVTAGRDLRVQAAQIDYANLTSGRAITMQTVAPPPAGFGPTIGNGNIAGGSITAATAVNVTARNAINAANITAGTINLTTTAGGVTSTGALRATTDLVVTSAGSITIANAQAGDDIRLTGAGMALGDLRATGTGADGEGDGADFTITATGNVTIDHAEARSDFRATSPGSFTTGLNSITTGGDIVITTGGPSNLGNSTAGGLINVTASQIDFNNLVAGGNVTLNANQPSATAGGNNRITGVRIDAGGDATLNAIAGITVGTINAVNNIVGNSNGAIAINNMTAGRDTTLASTGGAITFDRLSSQGAASVTAQTAITGQRITTGGNATLVAQTGNLTLIDPSTAPLPSTVGGNLVMRGNAIRFGALQVTGNALIDGVVLVQGNGLAVNGTTDLDADQGDLDVGIDAGGSITASADRIVLRGQGARPLNIARLTTDVGGATVTGTRDIVVQQANLAGNSRFEATGANLTINQATFGAGNLTALGRDVTLGTVTVAGDIDATATRGLIVNGAVVATNIRGASADINIGTNGRVGTLGRTQSITLRKNDGTVTAYVGGTGTRTGWHLDAAEIARLFGTDIVIDAGPVPTAQGPGPRAPDLLVDSFTVDAALQFGANGRLDIRTGGAMRVIGNVRVTNLADTQRLTLGAGERIEVISGQGSVVLTGAGNVLGGILDMVAGDILVATPAAIADIAAATTADQINDRLGLNDGVLSDQGNLAARGIVVGMRGGFYVQNTGQQGFPGRDYANRRGLTVGAGGLTIATGRTNAIVIINGQQLGAAGPITGLDVFPLFNINGSAGGGGFTNFNFESTVNGCIFVNVARCRFDPNDAFPVQDILEGDAAIAGDGLFQTNLLAPLIVLRGIDPLSGQPLIDDPVTGAGNEDLWNPDDEEEEGTQ